MRNQAKSFFQAALDAFSHAEDHLERDTDKDNAQVLLSLFYALEMLMKAARIEKSMDIFREKGRQTISFGEALKDFSRLAHAADMRILEEDRHSLQHFAQFAHRSRVEGHMESALKFAEQLVRNEFGFELASVRVVPAAEPAAPALHGQALDPGEELQRDAAFGGGVVVWAQARPNSDRLGIRLREADGTAGWLSEEEQFEYMPHTDGRLVAVYRQSGGIVLYDIESGTREILAETGGPGAVEDGIVAGQGLGIEDGLGGGVWLIPVDSKDPEQLDEQGDSPRLSGGKVVWQSLDDGILTICVRDVAGGEIETVERNAAGVTLHEGLLAWSERSARPPLWAMDLERRERIRVSDAGIMPDVCRNLIAFLRRREDFYDLVVYDFARQEPMMELEDVGFPTGRGPILTDGEVIWENGRDRGLNHLRVAALP